MRRFSPALAAALVACHASEPADVGADPTPTTAHTWWADARPIFQRSCMGCHQGGGLSGLSLTEFDDVSRWASAIEEAVASRAMPPWRADPDCNRYQGDLSLTEDERAVLLDWLGGGAPEGDPEDAAADVAWWEPPTLDRVDATLAMPEPYTPTTAPDEYRCFLVPWPFEERVRVTGYEVRPKDLGIVHHVIPFLIDPVDAAAYQALDEADPEPGYACYGGPGGDVETLINTRWLGAWAPGGGAETVPDGYGVRVEPGSLVALQVHYNHDGSGGVDQTALDVRVSTESLAWADVQPWTDVSWVFGLGMDIPAGAEGVTHTFSYTEESDTYTIQSAALHLHTLGRAADFRVIHADGTETCLVGISDWDFNWQRSYWLEEPVTVVPGDTVELTCTWDNPTDQDVKWGDGTEDEMCLGVTLLTAAE